MAKQTMTLDQALRPLEMTCGECHGRMIAYPAPIPKGIGYCPNCSPTWLQSFAIFLMNQERIKRGLQPIK